MQRQIQHLQLMKWHVLRWQSGRSRVKAMGRKIDETWFQKIVMKVLNNLRFQLGRLINTKAPKTPKSVHRMSEQSRSLEGLRAIQEEVRTDAINLSS